MHRLLFLAAAFAFAAIPCPASADTISVEGSAYFRLSGGLMGFWTLHLRAFLIYRDILYINRYFN